MPILPSLNSIKIGLTLVIEDEPYIVMEASFMRTAQRKPVMRTKLKHVKTGRVREISFKPGDKVEEAVVEKQKASFLYQDPQFGYFMDAVTFEQEAIEKSILEDKLKLLKEGEPVTIIRFKGTVINVDLPVKVRLKVTSADPAVRGDTAQGGVMKDATVETGAVIKVPLFIEEGEDVIINTESGEYVERAS